MKIAILTSGGDAPGMNACLYHFAKMAKQNKYDAYFIYKGFQGLIENEIVKADFEAVKNVAHLGGSVIKSYRSEEFMTPKGYKKALATLKAQKFDILVCIGGNGTFEGAKKLFYDKQNVICVPATIDNDLPYTERCLGFDTALNTCVNAIDAINQTMSSVDRMGIIEVMGRECGDLALYSGMSVDAEIIINQNNNYTYDEICKKAKALIKKEKRAPLMIVQENLLNVFELAKKLQNDLDIDVRASRLGYIQRGGSPSVLDRIYAKLYIEKTFNLIKEGRAGVGVASKYFDIQAIDIDNCTKIK